MSDTEKNLNKLLVITEKETQRIIQQFLRNSTTFSDECLEEFDLNKISSVKELSRYGIISSKITKTDTFFSGKCIKLTNTQVIVWKNSHTKELIIIFVENDSCNTVTDKTAYTVHINLIKNAIKELKLVKYSRVANSCHISRRNITRPSVKNILKRNAEGQPKYVKSSNKKLEQKWEKPKFLQRANNLKVFLKNTIDRDRNFTSKCATAIFTVENATKSEDVSKIFLTRPIRYKDDLNNFVNTIEEICPSMTCDRYEYIREKIHKNNIPVDNIKSIVFIRQKDVKIFLRTSIMKFSNNLLNKSSIKIGGEHFINVKHLNMKLETIKLLTPKCHNKCKISEKNIVSNTEIEEIQNDMHEPEKCIQNTSQDQTIASSSNVGTNKQLKIITIPAVAKLTKDLNKKLKSNIKEIQTVTSNKQQVKSLRKEETRILDKNLLKQVPKPVVNKAQVDNKPVVVNKNIVLSQIQESLKIITKRLTKNTQIIREIANKSSQFMVRGSQIPLQTREVVKTSSSRKNKVTEINRETKKPNETSQISAKSIMEQKLKHDRRLVTITPTKNYIGDNKRKVGDNSIRSGGSAQKVKKSSKNTSSITPVINSQYIDSSNSARKNHEPPKLANIIPVLERRRETPLIGKVMRPIPKVLPKSQNLRRLTINDLMPFRSEYPRKDHLNSVSKPQSRTEMFLNKLCSSNILEPLIKCSDKDCKSCAILAETKPTTKSEKKIKEPQQNGQFDFQRYINEPSTSYSSNCTLYPITEIQISPKINTNQIGQMKGPTCNSASNKFTPISSIYQAKAKQLSGDISKHSVNSKITKKIQHFGPSNKIQKAIEQSISKNNGQQKIVKQISKSVEQSRTASGETSINNRKEIRSKQNARNLTPKIFTPRRSNTSMRSVQHKVNPLCNNRKVNITKNVQKELLVEHKYKMHKNVCDPLKASENMLLETLSKTDGNSQADIQKYLVIIEQKFLKTFSLPEDQKIDAYNTLAQEINGMLSILSTENAQHKQLKIIESLERLTNMNGGAGPHKTRSCTKVSYTKKNFKFSTHSLIDLAPKLMMPEEANSSVEIKKKIADDAQPTVCTESISFMKSLSAIMSKQTQLFPSISESKNDNLRKPTSILKICSSGRVNSSKKVRFGAHDSKHMKSDVSVTFSSSSSDDDDEDYSTIYEDDVVNFTSEEDVTVNSPECSSLIYFKTDISHAFVENLREICCVILVFHQILINDQDSLHRVAYKTESDTPFIKTSEFEVRVNNDFDVTYSKSNFTFSSSIASTANLNCTFSDISNGNIDIDNVDYIPIEAKSSPNVIEFLDIMANLSFEPVPYREELFYESTISYIHTTYETAIYDTINIFHQIEIHFENNLQALVPKLGEQSKQLSELTGDMNFNLQPRLVSVKPLKLHSQYLEIAYRLQKEKYDTLMNLRKTRSLNMMLPIQNIHNQTLVLNMHVQNYQQSQIDNGNINSKSLEEKKDLRKAKDNCTVICNENEKIRRSYKSILIFLYIAIFCTILFCTFLINYKCE